MKRYPFSRLCVITGLSEEATARMVGMTTHERRRAVEFGLIEDAAERYAKAIGVPACWVWRDTWLDELEQECAERSCTVMFVPKRKGMRYCSKPCGQRAVDREYQRRRYNADPEYRARKLAHDAKYREEARRARLISSRRYYAENQAEILARKAAYREANRSRIAERQRERRARAKAAA